MAARASPGDDVLPDRRRHARRKPPESQSASTTYTFDPQHPVPTVGGNISSNQGLMTSGGFDQRPRDDTHAAGNRLPLSERRDVLVFRSEPLEEDLEVTGTTLVKLWISSTAPDTDFTAKLIDEIPPNPDYPLGFDLNLGDSIIRTRYREGLDHQAPPLEPGEIAPSHHHALSECQCLQERPSHSRRHLEQQLSPVRREPQHRRPAGRLSPHGPGRQHDSSRCGPPVASHLARDSGLRHELWATPSAPETARRRPGSMSR